LDEIAHKRGLSLLDQGLAAVARGEYSHARRLFKKSVENRATAEGFTYWGWMEHHSGNTLAAIRLCKVAIEIDPEFGNPYNDIGSYLIGLGDTESAIGYLKKAICAPRYEPRQFPHINLGRVYLAKGLPREAIEQFKKALEYAPDDPEVIRTIQSILATLH
jgi:tetratricopeptide (TPR) repeat protein